MATDPESLDAEGVPDLEGPLPEKADTGDPQEGVTPPADHPTASADWGTTAEEQRQGEPARLRVAREEPDPSTDPEAIAHVGDFDPESTAGLDDEDDVEGAEVFESDPHLGRSAEEAALHVTREE
jgi:hypothetical protein